jgi:hypothetical protein
MLKEQETGGYRKLYLLVVISVYVPDVILLSGLIAYKCVFCVRSGGQRKNGMGGWVLTVGRGVIG